MKARKTISMVTLHVLFRSGALIAPRPFEKWFMNSWLMGRLSDAGFEFLECTEYSPKVGGVIYPSVLTIPKADIHLMILSWYGPYENEILKSILAKHSELKNVVVLVHPGMVNITAFINNKMVKKSEKWFKLQLRRGGATAVLKEPDVRDQTGKDRLRFIRELNAVYWRLERKKEG